MSRTLRLGEKELAALLQKRTAVKRNKFNAERTKGGDSKKEAQHRLDLEIRERAGQIRNLRTQVWFGLEIGGELVARYRADFVYEKKRGTEWAKVVADTKGLQRGTAWELFQIKKKLMLLLHGIDVQVV